MSGRLAAVYTWLSTRRWERRARRTALAAFWSIRLLLGIALVLFALSFAGPPPVEPITVAYDSPDETAAAAVHNLQTASYQVTIEVRHSGDGGAPALVHRERRTVDNAGHRVLVERRRGEAVRNESSPAERLYGTYTTGFRRPGGAGANWTERPRVRYHPSWNVFRHAGALNGSNATVVTDTPETYAVRVTDREAVFETVEIPGRPSESPDNVTGTLRLVVDREDDRLRRATYTARATDRTATVTATYRFTYGPGADLDRPLATYPPGDEVLTRLDLGLRTVESVLRGDVV